MKNLWQGMCNASQPIGEVNYTPGIDIGEAYMATEQQLNNFPLDNMNTVMTAQPSAPKALKRGTSKRLKNFLTKEDEFLCSAYVNVSKDPIVGINQPIPSYRARIKAYFDEHSKTSRSQSSLQHRSKTLSRCLRELSGPLSSSFIVGFILRNEMKWNEWLASMSASNDEAPSVEPVEVNPDPTLPPQIARPVGRDKAKKARSSTSSSSSACLEVLQNMSMDWSAYEERVEAASKEEAKEIASHSDRKLAIQEEELQIQKAQVQLQQEMLQLQKEDREERVMTMDVDKMAPWVRDYYINKLKKISAMSLRDDDSSGPSGQ